MSTASFRERPSREDELERKLDEALHDTLTHVPLRKLFFSNTDALIERARFGTSAHCFFIDVRNMKIMNDTLEHEAADLLLQSIGGAAVVNPRPNIAFGRFGGDEFVLVIVGGSAAAARAIYENLKDRAFEIFEEQVSDHPDLFELEGEPTPDEVHQAASKWFSLTAGQTEMVVQSPYRNASEIRKELINRADRAMYKVKDVQKLASAFEQIHDRLALAKRAGKYLEPSLQWLDNKERRLTPSENNFRRMLLAHAELGQKVGCRLLKDEPSWVKQLTGDLPPELDAVPNVAIGMDIAFIAQERQRLDVIDPEIIFPPEALAREPRLAAAVERIQSHDYLAMVTEGDSRGYSIKSALNFEVPVMTPERDVLDLDDGQATYEFGI